MKLREKKGKITNSLVSDEPPHYSKNWLIKGKEMSHKYICWLSFVNGTTR